MPQLRFLGRRWRIASDTVPLFSGTLALLHFAFLIPLVIVESIIESQDYECEKKSHIQGGLWSIFALYICSIVVEVLIVMFGLRGGPLEEKKRKFVGPLLCLDIILLGLTIIPAIWNTYLVQLSELKKTCWSNNPCGYAYDIVPRACSVTGEEYTLTEPCKTILQNEKTYGEQCFLPWIDYALAWTVKYYNGSLTPPFTPPGAVSNASRCDDLDLTDKEFEEALMNNADLAEILLNELSLNEEFVTKNGDVVLTKNMTLSGQLHGIFLKTLGIAYIENNASQSAPWFSCMSEECQNLLRCGDECSSWDVLLNIPSSESRYQAFLAVVISSWIIIGISTIILYLTFNAFPDFEDEESWQQYVEKTGRAVFCKSLLEEVTTHEGTTASEEIGNLLHQLFGGIDLDFTDQLFGLYLVSERQKWRRAQAIVKALESNSIFIKKQKAPLKCRFICLILSKFRFFGGCGRNKTSANDREEKAITSPKMSSFEVSMQVDTNTVNEESFEDGRKPELDVPSKEASSFQTCNESKSSIKNVGQQSDSIDISYSLIELKSMRLSELISNSTQDNDRLGRDLDQSSDSDRGSRESIESALQKALILTYQKHALVTPASLYSLNLRISMSDYDASKLYLCHSSRVPYDKLKEAIQYLPFARASYALRSILWRYKPDLFSCDIHHTVDSCIDCCFPLKRTLKLNTYFMKRNLKAVLEVCNISVGDVLYASFVHSSIGILPYIILLDRVSESVIISIRGTVGFKDLITDLLSNPVDAEPRLPDWVAEECKKTFPEGQLELLCHSGVLASKNAILADLQERGFIVSCARTGKMDNNDECSDGHSSIPTFQQPMDESFDKLHSSGLRNGDGLNCSPGINNRLRILKLLSKFRDLSDDDPIPQDIEGAREAISDALCRRGWRLVVTGHSLGAAVATMLSFHLYEQFPDMRCFAFCPPGGLMSRNLSRLAERFCTSVVVGSDFISRLSFANTARLVDDMVFALARCRRPKLVVSASAALGNRRDPSTTSATFCDLEDIDPEVQDVLRRYIATSPLHSKSADARPMYPPGRVIFLRPYEDPEDRKKEVWDAVWLDPCDLIEEGILISSAMLRHHRMQSVFLALESAIKDSQPFFP